MTVKPGLTAPQAARLADVHPDTVKAWAVRYGLGRKVGGRWLFDPDAVERFTALRLRSAEAGQSIEPFGKPAGVSLGHVLRDQKRTGRRLQERAENLH